MFSSLFLLLLFIRSFNAFYLHDEETTEPEAPCNPGCINGGQCFLSSFCICPKGFSGRYCEVSLHEQCGVFPSMTTIEVDCVLCICYNGLFTCDTQPIGLCRRKSQVFQTPSVRINRALATLQHRFKNIRSFEPMIMPNVSLDGKQLVNLNGYRIVLNHASSRQSSLFLILLVQLILVWRF